MIAVARHATTAGARIPAAANRVETAAGTVAVGASDAAVDAVEVADDHPDQVAQPAVGICRLQSTPRRKAESSSALEIPVVDTSNADSNRADSNLEANNLAALTIADPKAEVPGQLGLPNPARKTKSSSLVNRWRNTATSL
jgi:hypothetical protein